MKTIIAITATLLFTVPAFAQEGEPLDLIGDINRGAVEARGEAIAEWNEARKEEEFETPSAARRALNNILQGLRENATRSRMYARKEGARSPSDYFTSDPSSGMNTGGSQGFGN